MGIEKMARTTSRRWACTVVAALLFVGLTARAGFAVCGTDVDTDGICDDVDNCVGMDRVGMISDCGALGSSIVCKEF